MAETKDVLLSFDKIREVPFGARFYKADLHFHTPASEDARGKNRYNFNPYKTKYPSRDCDFEEQCDKIKKIQDKILADARKIAVKITKRFVEEKLSLVAVTDHNAIGTLWDDAMSESGIMDLRAPTWYEIIDDEARKINEQAGKTLLTILPGVEISCRGIHILAIFPLLNPRRAAHFVICELLNEIGFTIDEWARNPKVGKRSIIDAVNLIRQKQGIPIIAHIDGSDQALLNLYRLNSGAMKDVFYNEKLSAVEIVKPSKFTRQDKKLKKTIKNWIESLRTEKEIDSITYLQGSDAHDLRTIGKRFSFVKMTSPSFDGLRTAIDIPSSRVRISTVHKAETSGWYIYGVEIKNKYFGRRFIRFNRHLNCICGGKESGKSSIFELMKKAVRPDCVEIEGEVKLFVEKIVDSIPYYYAFCPGNENPPVNLYSIDKTKRTVTKIDAAAARESAVEPKFYNSERIESLISRKDNLNEFLTEHFGNPTAANIKNFNKLFSLSYFLEKEKEPLLYAEKGKDGYKLSLNVNWQRGKKKMTDFFGLNNSLRRTSIMAIVIVSGSFGPLIIDAPEDNFDNNDIANFLVPLVKMYKDYRQVIVFTNSPNLATNSDPENYILLNTKGKKLSGITSGFSIDDKNKKELLIELTEGGVKSFKKRVDRYGIKKGG